MTSKDFLLLPLGEIVVPVERAETPIIGKRYRQIGVKLWGEGAYERESIDGSQTQYKTLSRVEADDIILNKIWARNGSVSVVPTSLAGCYVSGEFPTFAPIREKLEPRWFYWLTKTKYLWEQCDEKSRGTSGKNRIKPEKFLEVTIPLPSLQEQRRIVARIEELVGKVEEVRSLRQQAAKETEFIIGASQEKFFPPTADSIKLGTVSTVIDPNPSHRYPIYVDDGIPIISTVDFVGDDEISTKNVKRVPLSFYEDTLGRFGVGKGDIIFSRKGKVGYARPHPANLKLAMTHTLCVIQPDRNKVLPRYLLHFTRSPAFINYLIGTMNPNVGVPTLGLGVIRSAPFNLPSLYEQHRIVVYLDELQSKLDTIKSLREEAIKELDGLLPSILDKAFRGEL